MTPEQIVIDFCAAWDRLDWPAIHAHLSDDIHYHNIPMEPISGLAGFKAFFAAMPPSATRFEIHHIAAAGNVVLTERTDMLRFGGQDVSIRVMGAFEIRGGKIAVWRDYFDLGQFMAQMPAQDAPPKP
ncbi:limonene-1,2-epoxide hydrolase family protein [Sandarakinorhabdus sp. DWP1-3-1]|uniref:limonene-1,2-epoxide hydrolase family protein n=1 Tax=Sandarakinorhabdus sp. DWP1-3-1 TaxID=2804627 RepID=UPI003CF49A11